MNTDVSRELHRFKVGAFECIVVSDGTFAYPHPAQVLFANASQERLAPVLSEHGEHKKLWGMEPPVGAPRVFQG